MLRVGLTGGIGSGKSTVAQRLAELGADLIDADVVAREVVEPGTPGFTAVVETFGTEVVRPDGGLDREALGRIVFADPQRRNALNAIVHPLVHQRRAELADQAADDAIVVEDVPLLVENGLAPAYHLIIVVYAPADERVRRMVEGRGLMTDDAWARVRAQTDDDARRAVADVWLDNTGTVEDVIRRVDDVWSSRLVPFEENLRNRRRAPGRAVPALVPYDATWPRQADRLTARIEAAVGDRALRVDHVGGAAVPGIDARDVLNLLVVARSGGDIRQLADTLADIGFPARGWSDSAFASADPGRPAVVHVYGPDAPEWRTALLVRDWLRANADERERYNAWERAVEAGGVTTEKYTTAKRQWWGPAVARAEGWAARLNWFP